MKLPVFLLLSLAVLAACSPQAQLAPADGDIIDQEIEEIILDSEDDIEFVEDLDEDLEFLWIDDLDDVEIGELI